MSRVFPSGRLAAVLCLLLTATQPLAAQEPGDPGVRGQAAVHAVVNFADLARQEAAHPRPQQERVAIPFMPVPGPPEQAQEARPGPEKEAAPPLAGLGLPTAQVPSPSPVASFAALGDDNTKIPPDTAGAVGPNHLMVMLKSQVRVQNRAGSPELPGCPACDVSLDSFWSATGATGVFYPRVVYEPYNDRWIVAAVSGRASASSSVLIGTSRTGDPTGLWDLYAIDTDNTDTNWADYPMLGFNPLWAVVTVNRYAISNNAFVNSFIYAFNKSDLYNGGAVPVYTSFTDASPRGAPFPALTYDNSQPVMYLARVWENNFDLGDGTPAIGSLKISSITGSSNFPSYNANGAQITTPNPWAFVPNANGADFALQLGTTNKIQNGDSRLLNLVYRVYQGVGSLWTAHNAFLPASTPTRTAAQWWQFSTVGVLQQFGRVENSSGPVFYAYPSIAVNSQNDAMLGFSIFSSSQYAAAGYAARNALDTPGTMRDPVTLKAGEAPYYKVVAPDPYNRWGDYSATLVDPVNNTDFWTIQEYASSPVSGSDRWGTWWGKINPPPIGHLIVQKTTTPTADPTMFSIFASGTGAVMNSATATVTDALDKDYVVTPGTYSVAETVPAGWDMTGNNCQNLAVAADQTVFCQLSNVKRGHVIVQKTTSPAGDSTVFTINASGTGTIIGGGASTVTDALDRDYEVTPGTYTVAETVPAEWDKTGDNCLNLVVAAGQTVSCQLTNVKRGHLIVQKTTGPAGDPTVFTISASGSGTITGGGAGTVTDALDRDYEVTPGTYSVAETVPSGWSKTVDTCQNVVVPAGQTVFCQLTNVKWGHLIVQKTTDPVGDPTVFTISASGDGTITGGGAGTVTDATDRDYEVTPGTYSVAETVPAGWDKTGDTCQNVVVDAGEGKSCMLTNVKRGHIIVDKVTVPAGDEQLFTFTPTGFNSGNTFQLAHATTPFDSGLLVPGAYSVAETVPSGWDLASPVCTSSIADTEAAGSLELDAGETITCTFTNTKRGHLIVQKTTTPGADQTVFTISASGAGTITGGGAGTVTDALDRDYEVTPGTYSVSETVPPGWAKTGDDCQNVPVAAGQTQTCLLTNVMTGHIIVDKVTNPAGDPQSFDFTTTGTGYVGFSLTDAAAPNSQEVLPGAYTVAEMVPEGWDQTSAVCDNGEIIESIDVGPGETIICTFTNTKRRRNNQLVSD